MRVRIIEPTVKKEVKRKKVCAYARVSTDGRAQGDSLENQIQYYKKIIESNPEYEYIDVFADKGITGTTDNRPQFKAMMEHAKAGKIDLIITKSISRFARNTTIVLDTVRELKELGVEVRFEKENINTLSGDGELMLSVLSSFAQEESKNVSENVKWRIQQKFKEGKLHLNTDLFMGYDKDNNGNLIINEAEAKIVKRIFNEYLSGKGSTVIAKGLNKDGVKTVRGGNWNSSTVLNMLRNEKYKGDVHLQKYYTPNHLCKKSRTNDGAVDSYYLKGNHQSIISEEDWEKVQREIEVRGRSKGNTRENKEKYLKRYPLTGMLYCGKCGATLKRRIWNSNNKSRKVVWQCSNYIKNGKNACAGMAVDETAISKLNIKEKIIVQEEFKDGKKHYSYSSKERKKECRRGEQTEKTSDGSILQSVNRPIRTVIKL